MFRRKKFGYIWLLILALFLTLPQMPLLSQDSQEEEEKGKPDELFKLSLEELMNVKITTAGRTPEEIRDIPASVVVITRDDIEKYGYQSLAEVLENIPGLYYTDDYFMENFGVRGFWTEAALRNVIILVNDIEQTEYLGSENRLELINIPVEAIDRIEVVRGPMSVMYGTGAFFGVINIFTNKTDIYDGGPVSLISGSMGSEKTKKITVRVSDMSDDGDLQYTFNASYFDTYGLDVPYEKLGASGHPVPTTGGQLENSEKYFNFSGLFRGFSFDASYSETHNAVLVPLPSLEEGSRVVWRKVNVVFGYERVFSDKFKAEAKFGYFLNKWSFIYDYIWEDFYSRQTNYSSGYKAELDLFIDPSPDLNITFGLSYLKVMESGLDVAIPFFGFHNYHMYLAAGESMSNQAIYAQINYTFSEKFKIVAGARLEQVPEYTIEEIANGGMDTVDPALVQRITQATYSYTKAEFIPRVALIFQPHEDHALKFLYGKAINRPSLFQSRDLVVYPTSEPLNPEYIQTFELNYIATLSSKFTVSLSLFRNMLDDLIYRTYYTVEGELFSYFGNVGEMTTNGVELTIQAAPVEDFHLELSGTYQQTKEEPREGTDVKVPEDPGYSPKFLGYIKASYFFNDNISLAVTGNYVGQMKTYFDHTLEPESEEEGRIGEPVDGYFLLGANLRIRHLFDTGLFLNLRCSNLLDQEVYFPATSNNSGYAKKGTVGRGISLLLTLGWKF
jgi:outer membrane receptor protein involved in Fe transport